MRGNSQTRPNGSPRVLHVVRSLRGGGAETFVRELVPRLRVRGLDAQVLCAYGASGLSVEETQSWSGKIYCQQRSGVSKFAYLARLRRLMQQVAPDVVHTHTHVGASWGRAAAVLAGVPVIAHTEHRSVETLSYLERLAFGVLNNRTDVVVTFSERAAELVRRRENVRDLRIIPNGVVVRPSPSQGDRDAARDQLAFEQSSIIVGMIANLYAHKNPSAAIEAVASLSSQLRATVRLAMFGDGPQRSSLEQLARELGIRDCVRFFGFRADLELLLPGLDMVLTTSPREMMPMSLLEAMNAALPIVGTPHAGTLDLVVDAETGLIVRSWEPRQIAEAIAWAATNPEWRRRAGNAAYVRLAKNFDIEKVADQYFALYDSLLHREPALK